MYFQKHVCRYIKRLNTTIPFDIALQGVGIAGSIEINIDECARRISAADKGLEKIDFTDFIDVAPPVAGDNLFIQMQTSSIGQDGLEPGWIGVHCVDFNIARESLLYKHNTNSLDRILGYPLVLSFIIYREMEQGLSVSQAGILLGLEPGAGVSEPGFVSMPGNTLEDKKLRAQVFGHDAWIIYLVLNSFAMVNQKETFLRYENGIYTIV